MAAAPPQQAAGRAAAGSQAQAERPGRAAKTAPCPWCRQPMPPACCASCLRGLPWQPGRAASIAASEAERLALAATLDEGRRLLALRGRRASLRARSAELRADLERREADVRRLRRQLEERREKFGERRRWHE
ncbi:unnamed protein product, partial [Prorocentrum cordatum]